MARVTPSQDVTEAGTPRKRAQRACRECHAHKTKCSGSLPVCARCTNLGIQCIYEPSKRKFSSAPGSAASQPTKKNHHGLSPATNIQTTTTTTNFEAKQLVSPSISSLSPGPSASTRRASLANPLFAEYVPRTRSARLPKRSQNAHKLGIGTCCHKKTASRDIFRYGSSCLGACPYCLFFTRSQPSRILKRTDWTRLSGELSAQSPLASCVPDPGLCPNSLRSAPNRLTSIYSKTSVRHCVVTVAITSSYF